MKKIKELIGKSFKGKTGIIISVILGVLILAIVLSIILFNREEKVDTTYIISRLEKSSELTTAKIHYTGMSEFKDSGIIIINRSDFIMIYEATARVGIDVKEIKVEPDDLSHIVWLTIPKAKILDVKVDSSKIKYFDEKFSLFNVNSKEDANKAVSLAEKGAEEELLGMGILEMADAQAETLIKGLIQDAIPENYKIKIK